MATHNARLAQLEKVTQAEDAAPIIVCWDPPDPEQQREIDAAIANGDDPHLIIIRYRERKQLEGQFVFWPDG